MNQFVGDHKPYFVLTCPMGNALNKHGLLLKCLLLYTGL